MKRGRNGSSSFISLTNLCVKKKFPFYKQTEAKDCGPTCVKMIAKHYGQAIGTEQLRLLSETTRQGSSLLNLSEAVEKIGFRSLGVQVSYNHLKEAPLPCILHWGKEHYVVVSGFRKNAISVADPACGRLEYTKDEFIRGWIGNNANDQTNEGVALLLEPTAHFYDEAFDTEQKFGLAFISRYLLKYKQYIIQLLLGLIAGSIIQLIVPFFTQAIVDVGIKSQDLNFIYLILFAQIAIFIGRASLEFIRSWILLHLSTRINISIVSDFFIKLMKLPISFFEARMTGDLLQRIHDHERLEKILTTSSLNTLFSFLNLALLSCVLIYYNFQTFSVFLLGSSLYFGWVLFFFKKRKKLDYKRFSEQSKEQSKVIELISGMQEIKLHNAERRMRWSWEYIQANLFKVATKNLKLEQTQNIGSSFINELKNVSITVLAATLVLEGEITLGMMLAITYIVGQLNAPITQLIDFMRDLQDAKISVERLGEIHNKKEEEKDLPSHTELPESAVLSAHRLVFKYTGGHEPVLSNLSLSIPPNKVTAIVGASGSGKTTLMKVLLRFYEIEHGEVLYNNYNLNDISPKSWRDHCGVVMQEGYIFNNTIAKNIAVGDDDIDKDRLLHAMDVANLFEFVENLPNRYNTMVGSEGMGLSTGQKQRLLIARAVYKNPKLLFFDEATSALDARNESIIMKKLDDFFQNRTAVVIAHRLSTVKNAHQIAVMDKGSVVELGNHESLVRQQGKYFELVKNQLELGD